MGHASITVHLRPHYKKEYTERRPLELRAFRLAGSRARRAISLVEIHSIRDWRRKQISVRMSARGLHRHRLQSAPIALLETNAPMGFALFSAKIVQNRVD